MMSILFAAQGLVLSQSPEKESFHYEYSTSVDRTEKVEQTSLDRIEKEKKIEKVKQDVAKILDIIIETDKSPKNK